MRASLIPIYTSFFLFAAVLTTACGSSSNPFSNADADLTLPDADLTAPDADLSAPDARPPRPDAGPLGCVTAPTRMVVVGDSINWCWGIGFSPWPPADNPACGVKIFNDYMNQNYAAGISYENFSQPGNVTADISGQLGNMPVQAGHVLVVIYIGGNDLVDFLGLTDAESVTFFAQQMPAIRSEWETRIFPFFENANNFPDGVTVIMNTQYNPYDDCNTTANIKMTAVKIALLADFNTQLTEMADARDYAVITDQHGPFLGHGQTDTRTNSSCPSYVPNAEAWMSDEIHPNEAGYASLAAEWAKTADLMYGPGCL